MKKSTQTILFSCLFSIFAISIQAASATHNATDNKSDLLKKIRACRPACKKLITINKEECKQFQKIDYRRCIGQFYIDLRTNCIELCQRKKLTKQPSCEDMLKIITDYKYWRSPKANTLSCGQSYSEYGDKKKKARNKLDEQK